MKHNITSICEVRNYNNRQRILATPEFCLQNNILICGPKEYHQKCREGKACACYLDYHIAKPGPLKVHDVKGIKLAYLFGTKTWFDTQEELNAYRAAYHKDRAVEIYHNKVKKQIYEHLEHMSTEQLEMLLAKL